MDAILSQLREQFHLPLQNPVLVFALILLIILLAPILLKKLRVPGIIGLILAGVLFGPHGLNLLAKNSAIDLFSTIGLLYIMFIAGLELELHEFKKYRYHSIGFGFLTFIMPMALGFPAAYFILSYNFTASLMIGTLFATQTMIAYPIVTKFGISRNKAVAITVGGTILTDTGVLLLLAVITGVHAGSLEAGFWIKMIISVIFLLAVMFLVIPRIAQWFFRRLEGEKTSHYIFVLSIVFLAAFISQIAGLEPIIGAFIAGLALNKIVPQSSVLMNRIQFVGNALFIPFFLISVGMLVDLRVLLQGPKALWIAFVLLITALVGKYVAARLTQWIFGYSRNQGLLIFGLSASHAAAAMAVILVGYKAGIIDENILNGTIILILVSCLVASIATEAASKRIVMESEPGGALSEEQPAGYESIILPVANLKNLERILEFSFFIRDKRSKEPIRVLNLIDPGSNADLKLTQVSQEVDKVMANLALSDFHVLPVVAAEQNIAAGINRISREFEVTTIVMGWPTKESFSDRLFGQKTDHILESSGQAILVCRLMNPLNSFSRIVLFSPPFSEKEQGFEYLITKITTLAVEINLPVHLYCDSKTQEAVAVLLDKINRKPLFKNYEVQNWNEFLLMINKLAEKDLAIIFSARKGSVSHHSQMDQIFDRFNTVCPDRTVVITYPKVNLGNDKYDKYRDFYAEPLTRTAETFRNIQRGMEKMIHKAE
ncbi:MAG TPA: sodium:proton antiporter [Bacteroidales bacterium]|nr:sodium:proton antiporter [Bacteroidales bacterium]